MISETYQGYSIHVKFITNSLFIIFFIAKF